MIKVRVPLRICLAGGGTDLPGYSDKYGGFVVSAKINKFLDVIVAPGDDVTDRDRTISVQYLRAAGVYAHVPVWVETDVAPGSGLGGSGALIVGMLMASNPAACRRDLAWAAYSIERFSLRKHVGFQDHFSAAFHGAVLHIRDGGCVSDVSCVVKLARLKDRLVMFRTGIVRDADEVLRQQVGSFTGNGDALDKMHEIKDIGHRTIVDLWQGGHDLGELMHEHWLAKKGSCGATTTSQIDEWYEIARNNGAEGGKCIGAGGGGYMLFVCQPERRAGLVAALCEAGMQHEPFEFYDSGAEVLP